MNESITVIVPAYNAAETIDTCLKSVLSQGGIDVELVVVNDGSTDSTLAKLEKYRGLPKVSIVTQKNKGVSVARNKGISIAQGEYLFFLDSDDTIAEGTLASMFSFAKKHNLDLVACHHVETNTTQFGGNENRSKSFVAQTRETIAEHFLDIFPKSACAKLFKRELVVETQCTFPVGMALGEDMAFVYMYLISCNSIGLVEDGLYNVQNVNEFSLSKRYVSNIEESLIAQYKLWQGLVCKYPDISSSYYKEHIDFRFYLASLFFNNLFKQGSPYIFSEKVSIIRDKLMVYSPEVQKKVNPEALPKNWNERTLFWLIKLQNSLLIAVFFQLKEIFKKQKVRRKK